ncbi:MAG TPA: TMEM175 family protein [Chryseolinea sp.]|nr:TMEM175 family protein [Chryseolinea sp.]HPM28772.1 TMEM175 family protein [Chryseolinea sp.]
MIRDSIKKHYLGLSKEFRFRGEEPGRLENFSDAVFALAITLLLISTTPPNNFEQIKRFLWDLIPFCMCIALILLIWFEHFIFFFRYGMRNGKIVMLNTLFLVIVLFYVYPLKFLTKLFLFIPGYLFNQENLLTELKGMISGRDVGDLMIIYGLGATGVFSVLALMYRNAFQNADALELNEIERFDTRMSIRANVLMGSVPLVSVLMAIIFQNSMYSGMIAGFTYFLYTPIMILHGRKVDKAREKILKGSVDEDN